MNIEKMIEEDAVAEVFEILVDHEVVKGSALGIAKLVIAQGTDDLTSAQRPVYDRYIVPHLSMECSSCGEEFETDEIPHALMSFDKLCGGCRHREEKDD